MIHRTFVMIKPDGMQRKLMGEIISRFERAGLRIPVMKMVNISRETAKTHYEEHREKPFFDELVSHMSASTGRVLAMILWGGEDIVPRVRRMVGDTREPMPGSIRGDFATSITHNIIHASDSEEAVKREILLFFPEIVGERHSYLPTI